MSKLGNVRASDIEKALASKIIIKEIGITIDEFFELL